MNNFTKEELELTLSLYQEFMKKYEFTEDVESITNKILSMIENYCEHKNTRNGDPCQECEDCGIQII